MFTKKTDTDFDQLINAAKHKYTLNSPKNSKFHRQNSPGDPAMAKPVSVNCGAFFAPAGTNDSHELADSKFIIEQTPPDPNPLPNKHPESLGDKRWKYQGKTYKEEPIGRG